MTDLIERVARAIDAAAQPRLYRNGDMARAAIREVLAAMREPSEARAAVRLAMWRDTRPRVNAADWLAAVVDADLRAFAREHGLEAPDAG